jgi:urease accessory protein
MTSPNGPLRVGIGGPVGVWQDDADRNAVQGDARPLFRRVVTNDIFTKEDALILNRASGAAGGPHHRRRDRRLPAYGDPRGCLDQLAGHRRDEPRRFPKDLDVIFIESGGDNLAATFSPDLADITLYVISVCQGEKIPRKGGPASRGRTCSSSTRSTSLTMSAQTST